MSSARTDDHGRKNAFMRAPSPAKRGTYVRPPIRMLCQVHSWVMTFMLDETAGRGPTSVFKRKASYFSRHHWYPTSRSRKNLRFLKSSRSRTRQPTFPLK